MNRIIIRLCLFFSTIQLLTSCSKWIDISPRQEIREDEFFNSEIAFQEALNGVYFGMGHWSQYGGEMTFGMVDVMGDMYSTVSTSATNINVLTMPVEYKNVHQRLFNANDVAPKIRLMWANAYQNIANLNNLIKNLQQADEALFTNLNTRDILLGEAIGLRAFLHFDLLRLFAPSPNAAGSNQPVIPYVDSYGTDIKPLLSVSQVMTKIKADLLTAEKLLVADPIIHAQVASQAALTSRKVKFNYYAVKATQARVYLWNNEKSLALDAAKSVLEVSSLRFPWVTPGRVSTNVLYRDRIFSTELIFGLVVDKLEEQTRGLVNNLIEMRTWGAVFNVFHKTGLWITPEKRAEVFETATAGITDLRNLYLVDSEQLGSSSLDETALVYAKLKSPRYGADTAGYRMPLLRISEMHYIAAECLVESNPAEAVNLLNAVRLKRGIMTNLPITLAPSEIRTEIRKEYRKEFTSEGQMFFYRKRLGEMSVVLPLPVGELENR